MMMCRKLQMDLCCVYDQGAKMKWRPDGVQSDRYG